MYWTLELASYLSDAPWPATKDELIDFSRTKIAGFKCPKRIIFRELPKTSTGKIQKFELRKVAKDLP